MLLLANGSIASSITAGNTQSITEEFGISNVAAQLTTSLFLLGFCAGPLLFGPLSEFYGRQWLLHLTFILYFFFTCLTAWPPNLGSLLVGRFLAGCFAAGPFAIGPGVLADLWDKLFQELRGWNTAVSQLPVLGQAVGAVFGFLMVFDHTRRRKAKANTGREMLPEDHMVLAMIGGVGFPISMLWLCWSAKYNSVHWIVPTAGGTVLATCLMLIHVSCFSYITDAYADYAASVIAANIIARCISGAGAPLFTRQMFDALGVGNGGSLIAGVAAPLAVIPFLFYRYGHTIRSRSKYALA
ncbi:hypothetical protein FOQG_16287 [Fusarium oxysporum f. sp. raphani 54005]|uniref:Major facilitator superfamily (MFS) profile domain-containing protein n=2 Tax=Fusarium oxysporum f. sp. raphani TaxID=96318 RepID=X0C8P6_FUSOX|nr:hypothetical protein FOQG_16287 [Fusarium oxysporum f. sp. raphani 54005]KAG7434569.1 Efflux pump FUBT [Fusarium oxysporum f. sp. raphani]KAJ4094404.1 hypothetical protein NW769_012068 [Fusarium oxysporum]KAJ4218717.1 hypothetical protein NW760_012766 [Fusarium oxysporum]